MKVIVVAQYASYKNIEQSPNFTKKINDIKNKIKVLSTNPKKLNNKTDLSD